MNNYLMVGATPDHAGYPEDEVAFPLELLWKKKLNVLFYNPVVYENRIILTSPSSIEKKGKVFSLDAETGKIIWEVSPDSCSYIQGNICVEEGMVFYGASKGVYALRCSDGKVVWKQKGIGSEQILVHSDKLYINAKINKENGLYALDTYTGEVQWVYNNIYAKGLALYDNKLVFGDHISPREGGSLYSVNAENGALIWKTDLSEIGRHYDDSYIDHPPGSDKYIKGKLLSQFPVIVDRKIYCTLRRYVCCFDLDTGNLVWKTKVWAWELIYKDGMIYNFAGDDIICHNALTGEIVYKKNKGKRASSSHPKPFLSGNTLFVGDVDGLYAFDIKTGDKLWEYMAKNKGGGPSFSHPIYTNERLYARFATPRGSYIYCFGNK